MGCQMVVIQTSLEQINFKLPAEQVVYLQKSAELKLD